ncbi:serine hydrolase domain-containing protein [Kitasatospora purpeofusca]|uniref:serine hydrolase domain-containing protein n=1 Tax=Kitasatospora purpeofusca TaxID=67352 RepID=UPI00386D29A3|nr:beta-lactamase family protein [Kitasatospora purpeofusca]
MTRQRALRRGVGVAAVASALVVGTALPATAGVMTGGTGVTGGSSHGGSGHGGTRTAMDTAVRTEGLPGMIATAREGHDSWTTAIGTADTTTGQPRSTRERFRIGSVTKMFVATVVLQLQAEGRLDLDDTVDKWLPGVVSGNGNDGSAITVRQLLNHTSGLFAYDDDPGMAAVLFTPQFLSRRYDTYTPEQLVRIAVSHPPVFTPGAKREYSNTNYILAGMIVAEVTGHPYGTEIERRIIRPLGLGGTSVPGTATAVPRPRAHGYSKLFGGSPTPLDTTELNPSMAGAAGEIISTTDDLTRFLSALMRGRLLPQAELDEMLTTEGPGGLGIGGGTLSCGVAVWGHDGGIHGSSTLALTTRDGRHSVAFNTNADWFTGKLELAEAEFCG